MPQQGNLKFETRTLTAVATATAGATTIDAAAAFQSINIGATVPAGSWVVAVDITDLTVFSGGSVGDFTLDIGTSDDVDALVDGANLYAAAVDGGPSSMPLGVRPHKYFATAKQLTAKFMCGSDNVANATAGAVTIRVLIASFV